jgi:serine/threonine-protein kinase MRCK
MLKLEVHTEALIAEASKDKKLREQSEHYSKQLENELEGLKVLLRFMAPSEFSSA